MAEHICVSKLTILDSDNGLSPGRHQYIIWTNTGIYLIGPIGTNFSEIKIQNFSFMKLLLKMSSGECQPFCPWGGELSCILTIPQQMKSKSPFYMWRIHSFYCSSVELWVLRSLLRSKPWIFESHKPIQLVLIIRNHKIYIWKIWTGISYINLLLVRYDNCSDKGNSWAHCATDINSSPQNKMAVISPTIFSDAFSWMIFFLFWL